MNNNTGIKEKPIALVLGGTVPHCDLVTQLKQRGYYIILVDYTANPPAKTLVDEHVIESTLAYEKVYELAKNRDASLVISTCVDQANAVCCYVGEKMSLPIPYSFETAINVTDKTKMKRIMWDNNIPTSKYIYVDKIEDTKNISLKYPLMVKPADSNSANGVKRVMNAEELVLYLPEALQTSRNGKAIIEEYVEGVEISAYGVVIDGEAHLLMTQERLSTYDGEDNVIKCYASHAPARISKKATLNSEKILNAIAKVFRLENTPLFFQGIVNQDDVSVIEFAPRVGGGISSQTMKMATGYDIINAAIDSFLGRQLSIDSWSPMTDIYAVNQIYGKNGVFDCLLGDKILMEKKIVDILSLYKKRGAVIDTKRASSSRIGVMVVHGKSDECVCNKIKEAMDCLDVLDEAGNSIFRRDMYFKIE